MHSDLLHRLIMQAVNLKALGTKRDSRALNQLRPTALHFQHVFLSANRDVAFFPDGSVLKSLPIYIFLFALVTDLFSTLTHSQECSQLQARINPQRVNPRRKPPVQVLHLHGLRVQVRVSNKKRLTCPGLYCEDLFIPLENSLVRKVEVNCA